MEEKNKFLGFCAGKRYTQAHMHPHTHARAHTHAHILSLPIEVLLEPKSGLLEPEENKISLRAGRADN